MDPIEILVVEDLEDDAVALRRAFREARLLNPVDYVETGRDALDFLYRRGAYEKYAGRPLPGLLVLDLGLPDMTGLELLRELRADPPFAELPVLVLTVSDEDEDIIRSYDLGVQAFMQKPVRLHNLLDFFFGQERFSFYMVNDPS